MAEIFDDDFLKRDARTIARELLGKYLVRRIEKKTLSYMIVETEAYVGPHDKASHSYGGRRTKRNEVIWGPAGHWYVYFTYGMHHMLNLVTGKDGYPSAVLIRGIELVENYSLIRANKRIKRVLQSKKLDGPGKLTRTLKIDKRLNGKPASRGSWLWIEDRGVRIPRRAVLRTPRVGVGYAEEWVEKPLRYIIDESWLKKFRERTLKAR